MSSDVETVSLGFTTRLRYAYWVTTVVIIINVFGSIMLYGPVAGSVLWNEVTEDRIISWVYWWFWGQTLTFYTPSVTLWLMSHNWFGIYYAFHLATTIVAVAWQAVWAVFVIDVFIKCNPRFCDGDQAIAALNPKFGTAPDIGLWAYTGIVGLSFLCNLYYLVFNYYLHRKTEFRTQLEVAAASRAPDVARGYMYRSRSGGARWLFDAFSPPGTHAYGSFSPYSGGYQTTNAQINSTDAQHSAATQFAAAQDANIAQPLVGCDIVAAHGGSPAPTLDHLYSWSPWSFLTHDATKKTGWLYKMFSPRYASPEEQFLKRHTAIQLGIGQESKIYSPVPTTAFSPADASSQTNNSCSSDHHVSHAFSNSETMM